MLRRKGSYIFSIACMCVLLNLLFIHKGLAQLPYKSIPKIIFQESDAALYINSRYAGSTDSVQVIDLSVSVRNKITGYYLDSVWFTLRGAENLKRIRSSVRTSDRTSYIIEYVFQKRPEPFPVLTLEINSGQKTLGKINLQTEHNFIRLALVNTADTLTSYSYRTTGCVYINQVKHLVTPKLPENYSKTYDFKRQVK